jgi:hypothetical protein
MKKKTPSPKKPSRLPDDNKKSAQRKPNDSTKLHPAANQPANARNAQEEANLEQQRKETLTERD